MMRAKEALQILVQHRRDEIVLATMTANQIWSELSSHELDLPVTGTMSKASSLGLGLALARPERRLWVIDGDGSLLMNLGSLVTIANMMPSNFLHFVFHNGVYEFSGGQPLPGEGKVNFCGLANAAGYRNVYEFAYLLDFRHKIAEVVACQGPALACLHLEPLREPRKEVKVRTAQALHRVKAALEKSG
jgi:thiamine pyrophosphate-dependent acetolactate synthase large subunit-like protein